MCCCPAGGAKADGGARGDAGLEVGGAGLEIDAGIEVSIIKELLLTIKLRDW